MLQPLQRKCPTCDYVHTYSSMRYKQLAEKNNSKCAPCARRKYWLPEGQDLTRKCSGCGKVQTYKTPELWWKAENRDSQCKRCAAINKCPPVSEETRRKISEITKKHWEAGTGQASEASRQKSSKTHKERWGSVMYTPAIDEDAQGRKWARWCMSRDNFECVKCGAKGKLHVHHIKPKAQFPDLRFDYDNGITLCLEHHAQAHDELGQPVVASMIRGHDK